MLDIFQVVYHQYAEGPVLLLAYSALIGAGHPTPMDGQEVRWVSVKYLSSYELAEADWPIARKLPVEGKEH